MHLLKHHDDYFVEIVVSVNLKRREIHIDCVRIEMIECLIVSKVVIC